MTEMHSYRAYFLSVNDHIRYVPPLRPPMTHRHVQKLT